MTKILYELLNFDALIYLILKSKGLPKCLIKQIMLKYLIVKISWYRARNLIYKLDKNKPLLDGEKYLVRNNFFRDSKYYLWKGSEFKVRNDYDIYAFKKVNNLSKKFIQKFLNMMLSDINKYIFCFYDQIIFMSLGMQKKFISLYSCNGKKKILSYIHHKISILDYKNKIANHENQIKELKFSY